MVLTFRVSRSFEEAQEGLRSDSFWNETRIYAAKEEMIDEFHRIGSRADISSKISKYCWCVNQAGQLRPDVSGRTYSNRF
jgi:hypothetical protein